MKAAYLVGNIPFKILKKEPRVSYTLYILERHCLSTLGTPMEDDTGESPPSDQPRRLPLVVKHPRNTKGCPRLPRFFDSIRRRDAVAVLARCSQQELVVSKRCIITKSFAKTNFMQIWPCMILGSKSLGFGLALQPRKFL